MQPTGVHLDVYRVILIRKFLQNSLSAEEETDLTKWIEESSENKMLFLQTVKEYKKDLQINNNPKSQQLNLLATSKP